MRRVLIDELDSHIADLTDELVLLGYTHAEAEAEAKKRFGDRARIEAELVQLHPWLSSYADVLLAGCFAISILPLYALHLLSPTSAISLFTEVLLLWWWFAAAVISTALLLAWMFDVTGLTKRTAVVFGAAIITETALTITAIMDLNNFENAVDNSLVVAISSLVLWTIWSQLTAILKRAALFLLAALVITAALNERLFFPMLHNGCQFIYADTVLAGCVQIPWYSPSLWLVYAAAVGCVAVLGWYLRELWVSHSAWYRKVCTTAFCITLPMVALAQPNLNKQGDIDVIPWKREIYATYQEILGRDPEPKDLDFYASTQTYKQMYRIREVLYQSEERRIKINLLYQQTLQRDATTAEIDHYANSYLSISEISAELANPLTRFISN